MKVRKTTTGLINLRDIGIISYKPTLSPNPVEALSSNPTDSPPS